MTPWQFETWLKIEVLKQKQYFKMLGFFFSSKLDWGFYIISDDKTVSNKIRALIRSVKFVFPEFALYFYKCTIWLCIEYFCHVWGSAPSCYLKMLDNLQKRVFRTVGPSLAASLIYYANSWNVIILSPFLSIGITLVDVLAKLVVLPYFCGRCTRYSDRLPDFSVTIPRISMSVVCFHALLGSGIVCLESAFLWPMIWMALKVKNCQTFFKL